MNNCKCMKIIYVNYVEETNMEVILAALKTA